MTTTIYWTPVSKFYPPSYAPVLVTCGTSVHVGVVEWDAERGLWVDSGDRGGSGIRQDFTHWASLAGMTATPAPTD